MELRCRSCTSLGQYHNWVRSSTMSRVEKSSQVVQPAGRGWCSFRWKNCRKIETPLFPFCQSPRKPTGIRTGAWERFSRKKKFGLINGFRYCCQSLQFIVRVQNFMYLTAAAAANSLAYKDDKCTYAAVYNNAINWAGLLWALLTGKLMGIFEPHMHLCKIGS